MLSHNSVRLNKPLDDAWWTKDLSLLLEKHVFNWSKPEMDFENMV
jgi:hypothetical protein